MRNGMNKLLAVASALACACMWGCDFFDEEVMAVDKKRAGGYLVAILDDSLAFLRDGRGWEKQTDDCLYWENCEHGLRNDGLFLVNYRRKQAPLWGDTVNGDINIMSGLSSDSTIFFYDSEKYFGFWKVEHGIDLRKKMKWDDSCKWYGNIQNVRPWLDGKVLIRGAHHCPYALLDTTTGIVKKLELTGEYAWLEGCDDITYIDGEALCLKALYDEDRYGVYEYGKDGLIDSLIWNDASWSIYTKNVLEVWGGMFTIKHPTAMMNGEPNLFNGTFIHYLKPLGTPILPMRMEYNFFVDSMGTSIGYSSEDLVIAK